KKKGKDIGDGLPRLLTSDEFHSQVVEHAKVAVEEELVQEEQCKQWDEQTEAMGLWKEVEAVQFERNWVQRQAFKDKLVTWEAEKCRIHWNQPKLGKLESCLPKP
ncbi:hypothetical protein PAXRUDRAFT_83028, partial [Paxillus rubicundulus Ve08.2h10]